MQIQVGDYMITLDQTQLAGFSTAYSMILLVVSVFIIVCNWRIFSKAGVGGWKAIVPLLNVITLFKVAFGSGWYFLLMCIPFVNFIVLFVLQFKLAKSFGKGFGFGLGLLFFNPIFLAILAFSKTAQYTRGVVGYQYSTTYTSYENPNMYVAPSQEVAHRPQLNNRQPYQDANQPYQNQQPYQGNQRPYQGEQQYQQHPYQQQQTGNSSNDIWN